MNTDDGPYVTYSGLTAVAQRFISNRFLLPVVQGQASTVAEEAYLYLLLNSAGSAQTPEDLDRAARFANPDESHSATPSA